MTPPQTDEPPDSDRVVAALLGRLRRERLAASLAGRADLSASQARCAARTVTKQGDGVGRVLRALLDAGSIDLTARAELFHLLACEDGPAWDHTATALRQLCRGDLVRVDEMLAAAGAPVAARARACGLRL